ncbi:MAG: cytochrome b/b6 domain-containing protein [Pseudohongiellaceae bacterium]
MCNPSSLHDQDGSFGWISIALHWFTAIAITLLWFIGQSIAALSGIELDARRSLHVTLGLVFWLPLVARIVWRVRSRQPRVRGQSEIIHRLAKTAHYLMLVILSFLLLSGPLMALILPTGSPSMEVAFAIHSNAAKAIALLVVLHVLAALKHLMFHDDETIARIFVPRNKGSDL